MKLVKWLNKGEQGEDPSESLIPSQLTSHEGWDILQSQRLYTVTSLPTDKSRNIPHERPNFHASVAPEEPFLTLTYVKLLIESVCQGPPGYNHGLEFFLQNISTHLLSQ